MIRVTLLLSLFGASFYAATMEASDPTAPDPQAALARAAAYLWSQQGDDGSWRSEQYAVLRGGQALTPFVLHALLSVPEDVAPRPVGGVDRALQFLRQQVDDQGALGRVDPDILEYPVYSTAYAVRCFAKVGLAEDRELIGRMARFLLDAQFDQGEGFSSTDMAFGGWGFDVARAPGDPGHMDLAHTRRALEALADARRCGAISDSTAYVSRAREFLDIVQKVSPAANSSPRQPPTDGAVAEPALATVYDGGFYFSPIVLAANKGRTADDPAPHWRSYATATCDGILALVAGGSGPDDMRVAAAAKWLREHTNLLYPQGIPADYPEPWGDAVRYYHFAVRAEAYRALDWDAAERRELAQLVASLQRPDGSFVNDDSPLMKEDDPLMCTALAVVALSHGQ